jgi:hypothetical protein
VSNTSDVPTGNPPNVPAGDHRARPAAGRHRAELDGAPCERQLELHRQWPGCHLHQQPGAGRTGSGSSSAFTLPVTVTAAATGVLTNHASVGGGYDPFNNGNPPAPGAAAPTPTTARAAT